MKLEVIQLVNELTDLQAAIANSPTNPEWRRNCTAMTKRLQSLVDDCIINREQMHQLKYLILNARTIRTHHVKSDQLITFPTD